jgi:DNA-directed RNA polymerase subunit E'/Rpb7
MINEKEIKSDLVPTTPDDTVNDLIPTTPDGSPPDDTVNDLIPTTDIKKQQNIDQLKQTYADITKQKINRQKNIFSPVIDTKKMVLPVTHVDKNLENKLLKNLQNKLESKCNKHGLIKHDSVKIINISAPSVMGNHAEFHVTYQALTCDPVEGMIVEAKIANITKAGIRAELVNVDKSPMIIFISRDHNNNNHRFNSMKENEVINVKIIGVRYELNDEFVSVIGELYQYN